MTYKRHFSDMCDKISVLLLRNRHKKTGLYVFTTVVPCFFKCYGSDTECGVPYTVLCWPIKAAVYAKMSVHLLKMLKFIVYSLLVVSGSKATQSHEQPQPDTHGKESENYNTVGKKTMLL